jgi:hypothetical protein
LFPAHTLRPGVAGDHLGKRLLKKRFHRFAATLNLYEDVFSAVLLPMLNVVWFNVVFATEPFQRLRRFPVVVGHVHGGTFLGLGP